ncbi:MAG: hypothetical protein IT267_10515 [Saprospiraceae bacterium]|nr:hypothetical protein [Saprospiraceae bacterium]
MDNRYLIILIISLILACDKDTCPEMSKPTDPKPKVSNCVRDDSLPFVRISPFDKAGDTSNGYTLATLNYYTSYVGSAFISHTSDTEVFIESMYYYTLIPNCISSWLNFPKLKVGHDTINFNTLPNLSTPTFSYLDCDFIDACYDMDKSKNNYFVFTCIDSMKRILTAEFFCQLKIDPKCGSGRGPEILRFCDGQIRIKF